MKLVTKRILIAAATATILTLLLGTPEVITQLLIFVPSFAVTLAILYLLPKRTTPKS